MGVCVCGVLVSLFACRLGLFALPCLGGSGSRKLIKLKLIGSHCEQASCLSLLDIDK